MGEAWGSDILTDAYNNLSKNTTNANAGSLNGNRVFYNNDYMVRCILFLVDMSDACKKVQRGSGYVTTLRMFSSRTTNTECDNSQNPFGFHLSDGTVYTYLKGSEYEDIAAAWDWNLIPGITTDYAATNLSCGQTQNNGVESFVGGVSTGESGIGAMHYLNPLTETLSWQKAWFFLGNDVQHIMINSINSTTAAPVFSVLDQRKRVSEILVDGAPIHKPNNFSYASTLWHGNVGYSFLPSNTDQFWNPRPSTSLSVDFGNRTGNWTSLGISTQPPPNVDLFSAWLYHDNQSTPVSYTAFPATSYRSFTKKLARRPVTEINNDGIASAVMDNTLQTAMVVFWGENGGNVTIPGSYPGEAPIHLFSDRGLLIILDKRSWTLTVSEPTQTFINAEVTLRLGSGWLPRGWGGGKNKTVPIVLPSGGTAGSSVNYTLH